MRVHVKYFVRDEGTVVLFKGTLDDGTVIEFASDHRPARAIVEALATGGEPVYAEVERWQILMARRLT